MIKTSLLKYIFLPLLAVLTLSSGCQYYVFQKLNLDDVKKIEDIYVNINVDKVMNYEWIKDSTNPEAIALELFSEQQGVFVDRIVVEELNTALSQYGKFPVAKSPGKKTAIVNIVSIIYGFSPKPGFSFSKRKYRGAVVIECNMVDAEGKVIWRARSNEFSSSPIIYTADEMKDNPKLIDNAWRDASKKAIAYLVESLKENAPPITRPTQGNEVY